MKKKEKQNFASLLVWLSVAKFKSSAFSSHTEAHYTICNTIYIECVRSVSTHVDEIEHTHTPHHDMNMTETTVHRNAIIIVYVRRRWFSCRLDGTNGNARALTCFWFWLFRFRTADSHSCGICASMYWSALTLCTMPLYRTVVLVKRVNATSFRCEYLSCAAVVDVCVCVLDCCYGFQ